MSETCNAEVMCKANCVMFVKEIVSMCSLCDYSFARCHDCLCRVITSAGNNGLDNIGIYAIIV